MKFFSILVILITLAFSYQNCSVYESEGRALLNSQGASVYNKTAGITCAPYFNEQLLQSLFGHSPTQTHLYINESEEVVCYISTPKQSYECKFSREYSSETEKHNTEKYLMLENNSHLFSHYRQVTLQEIHTNELLFILQKDLPEAVGCKTKYDPQLFLQDLDTLATLTQTMLEQSIQTRP